MERELKVLKAQLETQLRSTAKSTDGNVRAKGMDTAHGHASGTTTGRRPEPEKLAAVLAGLSESQLASLQKIRMAGGSNDAVQQLVDDITPEQQARMRGKLQQQSQSTFHQQIDQEAWQAQTEAFVACLKDVGSDISRPQGYSQDEKWVEEALSQLTQSQRDTVEKKLSTTLLQIERDRALRIAEEEVQQSKVKVINGVLTESQRKQAAVLLQENKCLGEEHLRDRISSWLAETLVTEQRIEVRKLLRGK